MHASRIPNGERNSEPISSRWTWSVAIFASRERVIDLLETVSAAFAAAVVPTVIDVLVNGNDALANELEKRLVLALPRSNRVHVRVWELALPDKANAWNQYLHNICVPTALTFFLDGHCRVNEAGFQALAEGLQKSPMALAGSGVPSVGRTAQKWRAELLLNGGMVGGFLALKGETVRTLQQRQFRLPLGLYGFDGLLGAAFAFGLDPRQNSWQLKERIHVNAGATWLTTPKKWWRLSDLSAQFKRKQRIALRVLVGQATQDFFEKRRLLPEDLPHTTQEFVLNWAKQQPEAAQALVRSRPLCRLALRKLGRIQDWAAAEDAPKLIQSTRPSNIFRHDPRNVTALRLAPGEAP